MALSILCRLGRHRTPHPYFTVRNGETWFGECSRCHEQIVKQGRDRWREVPKGFRVTWRIPKDGGKIRQVPSIEPR
ncbi:MAG TPA: hypothetical protein VGC28_01515 [Sphingomonas sp.]